MPNNLSIGQLYGPGTAMPANPSIHGGMDLDMIYEINHRNRVLIIDDDPDMVGLLKEILRAAGFDVIGAYGCNEALKKCSDFPPHIILLDLMMPDIDGWVPLDRLKVDFWFLNVSQSIVWFGSAGQCHQPCGRRPLDNRPGCHWVPHFSHLSSKGFRLSKIIPTLASDFGSMVTAIVTSMLVRVSFH